ncbi:hypothetical protein DFJ73DRAFT_784923 [Zopfochytrium polystomum]|nr:hypothetical protein DFJ73DRAFT_784923 [Zopfochytrium polystomum]
MTICEYCPSPRETYAVATLFKLPRIKAEALLELNKRSLDRVPPPPRSTFSRHLQRERLGRLYSEYAMDLRLVGGGPPVVAGLWAAALWWKDSGLPLKYYLANI